MPMQMSIRPALLTAPRLLLTAPRQPEDRHGWAARLRAPLLVAAALVALAGCATPPPPGDKEATADFQRTNDPLEPANRVFYAVNDGLDVVFLRPIALAYRNVLPDPVQHGVHNVLANLSSPVRLANDMMQGKPRRAGDTLVRFVVNSTAGVVGIFDVADDLGYKYHDSDFGMTLANWGAGEGPYLFLPVLGPSNPRDAAGFGVDIALDPLTWVGKGSTVTDLGLTRTGLSAVDARAGVLDDFDKIKKQALDPYATVRSVYRQYRRAKIKAEQDDNRATYPTAWKSQPPAASR
jgi:phospholipid-binding lipoprotein MlaA